MIASANQELSRLCAEGDPSFFARLAERTRSCEELSELLYLARLRKRSRLGTTGEPLRVAIVGGIGFHPIAELFEHFLSVEGYACETFLGSFDAYRAEILDPQGPLRAFRPDVAVVVPSDGRCRYGGKPLDPLASQRQSVKAAASEILDLCGVLRESTGCEIVLNGFTPPFDFDLGSFRNRTLASDWMFRKAVNIELGLEAPPYVHVCDMEFLHYRNGALRSHDSRSWYEHRMPWSSEMIVRVAREWTHLVSSLRMPAKKVLVLDLDDTLWGGVVGDEGLAGIDLGSGTPRGEAFKDLQSYVLSLSERGVLLAVSSKNDHETALEPFLLHPESVLRPEHFVAFKANWRPKPENLREIAGDLKLGLESLVFVDDNPAEIEAVRLAMPEVSTILLDGDPADHVARLRNSRLFEISSLSDEDSRRTSLYRIEAERTKLATSAPDMDSYLESLDMVATISTISAPDIARVAQLINKSNQFNLTTKRRSETEVAQVVGDPDFVAFAIRLRDRFADHGLISVLFARRENDELHVDTWLMSCRVLERGVEAEALNRLVREARALGAQRIVGELIPTAKNGLVREHYPRLGFSVLSADDDRLLFSLDVASAKSKPSKIRVEEKA